MCQIDSNDGVEKDYQLAAIVKQNTVFHFGDNHPL